MNNARNMKKTGNAILNSKIFWIVVSVLIAFFLWLYVTSTDGVETEKTFNGVKVEFIGADTLRESSGLIVTEQDCTTVNLVLSGTRRVLSKLTSSNITAAVDLSNVFADARYSVSYSLRYPSSVSESEVTVVRSLAVDPRSNLPPSLRSSGRSRLSACTRR